MHQVLFKLVLLIYNSLQAPTLSSLQYLSCLSVSALVMMRAFQVGETCSHRESASDLSARLYRQDQHIRCTVLPGVEPDVVNIRGSLQT